MRDPTLEALAKATLAHGLIQLVVHFPETLSEIALTPSEALERAWELAEQAVALKPTLADGHVALGRALLCHDGPEAIDDAIAVLNHAHALDPDHDGAEMALAAAFNERGEWTMALGHVDAVLKRGNGQAQALVLRALLMLGHGHADEARRDIERAVRIAPQAGLVHLDAAHVLHELGDHERAQLHEERAQALLGPAFAAVKRSLLPATAAT